MAEMREQQVFADAPIITDGLPSQYPDIDEVETSEWLESFDAVVGERGRARGRFLLLKVLERARQLNIGVPSLTTTDYVNTIPPEREPAFPGDEHLERRIRAYVRWNAAVMVHRTNVERGPVGTSGRTRRLPRCTRWGSTISSGAGTIRVVATRCSSRGMPRRGSMRGRSWRGGSSRSSWTGSAPRWSRVG
jgi:hypothetical protein